jgi:hypothetical protein
LLLACKQANIDLYQAKEITMYTVTKSQPKPPAQFELFAELFQQDQLNKVVRIVVPNNGQRCGLQLREVLKASFPDWELVCWWTAD